MHILNQYHRNCKSSKNPEMIIRKLKLNILYIPIFLYYLGLLYTIWPGCSLKMKNVFQNKAKAHSALQLSLLLHKVILPPLALIGPSTLEVLKV